jgi:hypothetical protein
VGSDFEPLTAQFFDEAGRKFGGQFRIIRQRQVADLSSLYTAQMIMIVAAAVIASWALGVGELGRELDLYQRFQRFIYRREADVGDIFTDCYVDLLGRWMSGNGTQVRVDRGALTRETPAGSLQGLA